MWKRLQCLSAVSQIETPNTVEGYRERREGLQCLSAVSQIETKEIAERFPKKEIVSLQCLSAVSQIETFVTITHNWTK